MSVTKYYIGECDNCGKKTSPMPVGFAGNELRFKLRKLGWIVSRDNQHYCSSECRKGILKSSPTQPVSDELCSECGGGGIIEIVNGGQVEDHTCKTCNGVGRVSKGEK